MAKFTGKSYVAENSSLIDGEQLLTIWSNGKQFEVAWRLWVIEIAKKDPKILAHLYEIVSAIKNSLDINLNSSEQEERQDGESEKGNTIN